MCSRMTLQTVSGGKCFSTAFISTFVRFFSTVRSLVDLKKNVFESREHKNNRRSGQWATRRMCAIFLRWMVPGKHRKSENKQMTLKFGRSKIWPGLFSGNLWQASCCFSNRSMGFKNTAAYEINVCSGKFVKTLSTTPVIKMNYIFRLNTLRWCAVVYTFPHPACEQWNGFIPEWVFTCLLRSLWVMNALSQPCDSHSNMSPVWLRMCAFSLYGVENCLEQPTTSQG